MARYRVTLELGGPLGTPLQSGTLFGHLCWAYRYANGTEALSRWLEAMPSHPLLLSDALPAGHLPRPLLAPARPPRQTAGESRGSFRAGMERAKALRRRAWVRVDAFLHDRGALSERKLMQRLQSDDERTWSSEVVQVRHAHNTIDRHTDTTPETGGLFFVDDQWADGDSARREVYVRTELPSAEVSDLFEAVGTLGYGRDATLGRGRFKARLEPADARLFEHPGNRMLSLSHGSLSANMGAPRYRNHVHYGKLGGLYAGGVRSPFKRPLRLVSPGATFAADDDGPFGHLLSSVHPDHSEIVHNAWHLCVPYTEVATETEQ